MRFRYTLGRQDGQVFARDVSADSVSEAAIVCDEVWREADLDPLSDDPSIQLRLLPDA